MSRLVVLPRDEPLARLAARRDKHQPVDIASHRLQILVIGERLIRLTAAGAADAPLPSGIRGIIEQRLGRLPADCRALLETGALRQAMDLMFRHGGSTSFKTESRLAEVWRDLQVVGQAATLAPEWYPIGGRAFLGLDPGPRLN